MKTVEKITKTEIAILTATALFLVLAAVLHITFSGREYEGFTVTSARAAAEEPSSALIDINTADEALLRQLPGIGPSLAARIVAYRTENGPFQSVEELTRVSGIGSQTLEAVRPYITVQNTP